MFRVPTNVRKRSVSSVSLLLGAVGVVYLIFKCFQVSEFAGYDFKFVWLAGELWAEGMNPYGAPYSELGPEKISFGNLPELWVYPPNWWPISSVLAKMDLLRANFIYNVINVGLLVASSVILVAALRPVANGTYRRNDVGFGIHLSPVELVALHIYLMAGFESVAIVLSAGQNSIIVYLGVSILLLGLVRRNTLLSAAGLVLMLLKPQIGAVFLVPLLFLGRQERKAVLYALAASVVMSIPALLVSPDAAIGFLRNISLNDSYTKANHAPSMTGVRTLVWKLTDLDIGAMAATMIAVIAGLALVRGPMRVTHSESRDEEAWKMIAVLTAVTTAVAPLHFYDLVIIGPALFLPLFGVNFFARILAVAGLLILWRAENLGSLTGLLSHGVEVFPASHLATIGAMLFLIAIVAVCRDRWPKLTSEEKYASEPESKAASAR